MGRLGVLSGISTALVLSAAGGAFVLVVTADPSRALTALLIGFAVGVMIFGMFAVTAGRGDRNEE